MYRAHKLSSPLLCISEPCTIHEIPSLVCNNFPKINSSNAYLCASKHAATQVSYANPLCMFNAPHAYAYFIMETCRFVRRCRCEKQSSYGPKLKKKSNRNCYGFAFAQKKDPKKERNNVKVKSPCKCIYLHLCVCVYECVRRLSLTMFSFRCADDVAPCWRAIVTHPISVHLVLLCAYVHRATGAPTKNNLLKICMSFNAVVWGAR